MSFRMFSYFCQLKTEIAYKIAQDLDIEMARKPSSQTLKLHETDSTDSIYYIIEAIRYVTSY